MEIAIVGAGLSGSNVLKTLINHPNFQADDHIDIFEPRTILGPGLPYNPADDESIMLNTSPDVLSVDEENADDFTEWLAEKYDEPKNFEQLVSRPRYGKYLVERFNDDYTHEQVHHIQQAVVDMHVFDAQTKEPAVDTQDGEMLYRLKTEKGWEDKYYDAVFFTVGHPEYNDFYELKGTKNYIHNPYPMVDKLSHFTNEQQIGVVGSGATGIDLMRFFSTHYELEHPLTFYDVKDPFHSVNIPYEKGEVAYRMTEEWIAQEKEMHDGFVPLQVILDAVKADLEKENADLLQVYDRYKAGTLETNRQAFETRDQKLAAVQQYFSQIVPYLPHLYNALTGEDQKEYMKDYHHIMNFFKSKVPYYSYKWLFELVDAGKLKTVSNMKEVRPLEKGRFEMISEDSVTEVDILVNATGFNQNLESLANYSEFIKNLFNRRIIIPHVDGKFVLVDWPTCRVVNQRFGRMENVFFLGLLIGGTQHENNDAGQTIRQARYTAKTYMDLR